MSDNNGHTGDWQGRSIANPDLPKLSRAHAGIAQKQLEIGQIFWTSDFGVWLGNMDKFDWLADEFASGRVIRYRQSLATDFR